MSLAIKRDVSLARYTSLHVGGPARFFVSVNNDAEVAAALTYAVSQRLPFFILGKGSNTLFPDSGYPGLVVHMTDREIRVSGDTVVASSGVFMRQLVNAALKHSLVGLEELAGIPGTVGGAVRGNAGTWHTETKDVVTAVEVMQPDGGGWQTVRLPSGDCQFGYRSSIFKHERRWVILRAHFDLIKGDAAAASQLVAKDLHDRHDRQPYDAPSAGSIFKNPDKAHGIYAGALIEAVSLKGATAGGAEISTKHANFIVNRGRATSADVRTLIMRAQRRVLDTSGIVLEPEIEIVGETGD